MDLEKKDIEIIQANVEKALKGAEELLRSEIALFRLNITRGNELNRITIAY